MRARAASTGLTPVTVLEIDPCYYKLDVLAGAGGAVEIRARATQAQGERAEADVRREHELTLTPRERERRMEEQRGNAATHSPIQKL